MELTWKIDVYVRDFGNFGVMEMWLWRMPADSFRSKEFAPNAWMDIGQIASQPKNFEKALTNKCHRHLEIPQWPFPTSGSKAFGTGHSALHVQLGPVDQKLLMISYSKKHRFHVAGVFQATSSWKKTTSILRSWSFDPENFHGLTPTGQLMSSKRTNISRPLTYHANHHPKPNGRYSMSKNPWSCLWIRLLKVLKTQTPQLRKNSPFLGGLPWRRNPTTGDTTSQRCKNSHIQGVTSGHESWMRSKLI